MAKPNAVPPRNKLKPTDCWDLSSLLADDAAWDEAFSAWEKQIDRYGQFQC